MQHGVWPVVTLIHDPMISAEGNRFLLTRFQLWRGWEHSCCNNPFSPQRPSTSLASQKITSQNHAQKFPISWSACKQISTLSGMCTGGLQSHHLVVAAPSLRIWVQGSQSPCGSPGPVCPAALDQCPRGCSPARQCPSMGPALQEQASNHLGPSICQSHEGSSPCREHGPETWSIQVYLQPKVSSQSSMSQEPRESQEPAPSAQKPESPERSFSRDMFQKSSLLESHAPQKPLGVLSF